MLAGRFRAAAAPRLRREPRPEARLQAAQAHEVGVGFEALQQGAGLVALRVEQPARDEHAVARARPVDATRVAAQGRTGPADALEGAGPGSSCAGGGRDLEHEGRGSDYRITTYVDEALLRADRIKLRQSIRNLVANALDAQPTGGAVEVEATKVGEETTVARIKALIDEAQLKKLPASDWPTALPPGTYQPFWESPLSFTFSPAISCALSPC